MNDLLKAAAVWAVVWMGITAFRKATENLEDEYLARHSAGESDFQHGHPTE